MGEGKKEKLPSSLVVEEKAEDAKVKGDAQEVEEIVEEAQSEEKKHDEL
jgi:hypothetical protein